VDDNKNKPAAPVDSDILQGKADVLRAVKAAGESSKASLPVPEKPDEEAAAVPRFNLAEKILVEQRRFASERRRRTHTGDETGGRYTADDTVGAVIREVKDSMPRPVTAAEPSGRAEAPVGRGDADGVDLTAPEKRLIADIVARDIAALCSGRRRDSSVRQN